MGHDDHDDHAQTCAHIIWELQDAFGCPFQDKDFQQIAFEQFVDNLQWAAEHQIDQTAPIFCALHHHQKCAHGHRYVKHALHQHRHHTSAPFDEFAIGFGVFRRKTCDLFAGFIDRNIGPHVGKVLENKAHGGIRVDVFQTVFRFQAQFVIQKHWICLNHSVDHGMFVVQEPRCGTGQRHRAAAGEFLFL